MNGTRFLESGWGFDTVTEFLGQARRDTTPWKTLEMVGVISSVSLLWSAPSALGQEPSSGASSSEHITTSSLAYVSDFFSFIGTDTLGHVAFALDNNRGRDRDTWQAEHLVVLLHDEREGWKELEGSGTFDNRNKQLLDLPNSPYFQFQGDPAIGLTIRNPQYQLTLQIGPVTEHLSRTQGASHYQMGSAMGVMQWKDRTLKGSIIHERLSMVDFNRLTHRYLDLWTESHGLYAWAEESSDFLYFHSQTKATRLTPLIGNLVGYGMFANHGEFLDNLELTVLNSTLAWGFYRWPEVWKGQWVGHHGPGSIDMRISDLKVISNFILGGLAMGIIQGKVTYNGKTRTIYGLAELLI